jgi:hypothetical protein
MQALLLGVPVLLWTPSFLPPKMAFGNDGEAERVCDACQLHDALNRTLSRREPAGSHTNTAAPLEHYVSLGQETASHRIWREIERLLRRNRLSQGIPIAKT